MSWVRSIRNAFGWCPKQQRAVDRIPQMYGSGNAASQMGDYKRNIHRTASALGWMQNSGNQHQTYNPVGVSEGGNELKVNNRRTFSARNEGGLGLQRVGWYAHDGSFQAREWDESSQSWVPLILNATGNAYVRAS